MSDDHEIPDNLRRIPRKEPHMAKAPFTDTPEFREAVAEEAAKAVAALRAEILEHLPKGSASASANDGAPDWMQGLAMAIAQIADQGTGRKRVAPEILKMREDANRRMQHLLLEASKNWREAKERDDRADMERWMPTYRLRAKTHLDEMLIDPVYIGPDRIARAREIDWPAAPNDAMVPINEVAKAIYAAFQQSIGSVVQMPGEPPLPLADGLKITKKGLVVRGGPRAAAHETTLEHVESNIAREQGVGIRDKGMPGTFAPVHVLGTIMKPAQRNV